MKPIQIIIVDDHKIVRDGLKAMLIGIMQIKVMADVGSGSSLFKVLEEKTPELIVLDISMPGESGIEITKKLKEKHPYIKILILTSNTDEQTLVESVKAGATGFLPKDTSREEFFEAIEKVANGQEYFGENISSVLHHAFISQINKKPIPKLSDREIEIIQGLCDGLSHKEIGAKLFISPRTVETHKNNILKKLEIENTIQLVKLAIKVGIIES